jgi:hypothetical protein
MKDHEVKERELLHAKQVAEERMRALERENREKREALEAKMANAQK